MAMEWLPPAFREIYGDTTWWIGIRSVFGLWCWVGTAGIPQPRLHVDLAWLLVRFWPLWPAIVGGVGVMLWNP